MPSRKYTKAQLGVGGDPPTELVHVFRPCFHTWQEELSQDLVETLVENAAKGPWKKHAALASCVRPALFEWWLEQGMRTDSPPLMVQLAVRVHCAYARLSIELSDVITKAARNGEWEAAVVILTRRFPEWNGKEQQPEKDSVAPEMSLAERRQQMADALADPQGDLALALKAAMSHPAGLLKKLLSEG